MAAPSHNRAFQTYNSRTFQNRPAIKPTLISTTREPLVFGRIPYSSIKPSIETVPSTSSSSGPNSILKPKPFTPKRRSSVSNFGRLLSRRKSLQMTPLASQRQALWMSIAKNAQSNNTQSSLFPLCQQQTNLTRKKLLRLLLVFSYLLSISLFAIALATFYGFFWSGYGTTPTVTQISHIGTTVSSIVPLKTNSTFIDIDFSLEDVS